MRPWRPQIPVRSPTRSPKKSRHGNCKRKAKLYSSLLIFGLVVYLEILFLSHWSLDRLLNRRESYNDPDGTFNGFPVRLQIITDNSHTKPKSNIHCIGENYQADHWMLRSCNIRFMCFNLKEQEYEIYSRPEDVSLKEWTDQIFTMDAAQTLLQSATTGDVDTKYGDTGNLAASVSLGGIPPTWEKSANTQQSYQLKYFPKVKSTPPATFYALPEDVVMIPYQPVASTANPLMSLLWDDYMSIFNLLHIFQFDQSYRPLLLRQTPVGDDEEISKGTSTFMMRPPSVLTSRQQVQLELSNSKSFTLFADQYPKSDLICAKQGLMGTGGLTSYGTNRTSGPLDAKSEQIKKRKRQRRRSVNSKVGMTQNRGRGGIVSKFRLWTLQNLELYESGLPAVDLANIAHKIVLATSPETKPLVGIMEKVFSDDGRVSKVEGYDWKSVSPLDQVKLLSETSVFVSSAQQDLATVPFLPSGASLILLFSPKGDSPDPSEEYWDFLNNLSHIRVHWFPLMKADDVHDADSDDAKILIKLVTRTISYYDRDDLD